MALGRNHKIFNIGNASGTIQGLTRVYHDLSLSGDGTLSSLLGVVGDKADEEVNQYVYDNSATIDNVNTSYQTNSGTFLTAIPDYYATTGDINDLAQSISETYQVKGDYVERNAMDSAIEFATSGKLNASSFASVSGDFLVASSLDGYATESFVEDTSGAITSLIPTNYYPDTNPSSFVNEDWVTAQGYITGVDLTPYQTTAGMTAYATTSVVANKLDTTAFSDVSGSFLTAHQTIPSAKWETASDVVQSNSAQWSENTGDEEVNNAVYNNSAKWNDISVYQSNSSTYLTAHQDISNKLDTTAFSEVSGDFLTTAFEIPQSAKWEEATQTYQNASGTYLTAISIPESATWNDVSTTVQTNSADWASHQDLSYISAQVDNKLDSSSFVPSDFYPMTGNPSGFLTAHQDWTDTITAASANAYNEAIAQIPAPFDPTYISGVIDNKLDTTAFSDVSGSFLTAVDLTPYATTAEVDTLSSMLSGAIDYVSANAGGEFPSSANDAITAYQNASGTYLTAHQPISANEWNSVYDTVESNSGSWNEISAVSSNSWPLTASSFTAHNRNIDIIGYTNHHIELAINLVGSYIKSEYLGHSEENWGISQSRVYGGGNYDSPAWLLYKDGVGSSGCGWFYGSAEYNKLNDSYVLLSTNSATWNEITVYQSHSGTYLTAVDLSNYYTKSETSGADELANAFANIPTGFVPQSAFDELKTSYDALSSLFATYSGQWLLPNEGV